MITYTTQLNDIPSTTSFSQTILCGTTSLIFYFYWCEDIQEVYSEFVRALAARASADPWLKGAEIVRDYDWITLYSLTIPHTTEEEVIVWLTEQQSYPQSLKNLVDTPSLLYTEVYNRCIEADEIARRLKPYREQLCWHCEITDAAGVSVSAVVRNGGWLHEQDESWRVRFSMDKEIARDELNLITIDIEVAE